MEWQKLTDATEKELVRGYLLKYPIDKEKSDWRLMMICEAPRGEGGAGLIRIDGYDAGINPYVIFPNDRGGHDFIVTADWLVHHWNKWVCPDGDVNDVLVREALDVNEL